MSEWIINKKPFTRWKMSSVHNWTNITFLIIFFILIVSACDGDKNISQTTGTLSKKNKFLNELENGQLAVCYSGFRSGQHPDRGNGAINPSYEEIREDLQLLLSETPFKLIRLYDCGENTAMTLRIIQENDLPIKVLLGIWLRAEISNHETCEWLSEPIPDEILSQNKQLNLEEIRQGIVLANEYEDIIVAVNVGNEALVDWNDHKVDVDTIITYVKKVKESISQAVTVADNYKWWADLGKKLSNEVDFISIHLYPVWEGKDIDEGRAYSIENYLEVKSSFPEKAIVITEAGWPSKASEFGERASEQKQQQYYDEMIAWSSENNITIFFFEAFDEDWKGDPNNPDGAEKHWGLYNVNRQDKLVVKSLKVYHEEDKD